ncbi:alpha-N-acetylgalactosaminidase-like [Trachinotus anak]|uniref:alpha-N-acetylgalactosaminidase-like n=1 Tax=Trachinotus anak TaxID=443729 RepID=UPI0039F18304
MQLVVLIFVVVLSVATFALNNGLMRTPPMGWLAWQRFRCNIDCEHDPNNCISENLFIDMADRLSKDGWQELGYIYVNIDDCWSSMERDEQGRLQPDPKRFPGGIRKLAHYMHDRGLKLGIYGDMGAKTCEGFPGTPLDKIKIDAQTFADWEVDMLKFDGCHSNATEQELGYPLMSKALNATGRPIGYSCSWPVYQDCLPPKVNFTLLGEICNLWRNYYDIEDSWDSVLNIIDWFFDNQDVLMPAAGPGRWNDPDMLIIGDFGLSTDQSRAQMALWAIMAAPLLMSNDLRAISSEAHSILQNRLAISINQDPMGVQGRRIIKEESGIEVFWRPLSSNASALVFFSRHDDMPCHYQTSLSKLSYTTGSYRIIDVFTNKTTILEDSTHFVVSVNPTGVVMWHVSAPAKLNLRQFYKGGQLQGSGYDDEKAV